MSDASAERRRSANRPVAVVTGGGGGIGAAIAEALGARDWLVVTVDPLVSLDGSQTLDFSEETTAGRIVARGGAARSSNISVTDGRAVRALFEDLVEEFDRLDAVVNVAGISRPTTYTRGSDDDWRDVLSVHLDGYVNVLSAALPIMAAAGRGHVLGVTSGSGWREADAGAYGCAKRAVAALTWQLGRGAPEGVVVNAMSPIAVTRMVTAALEAAQAKAGSGGGSSTGGLSLASMPTPDQLGPFAAHLIEDSFDSCRGRILFAGGSEVAVIAPPRLLEVVRTDALSLATVLDKVTTAALVPAEATQSSAGATNPRFGPVFEETNTDELSPPVVTACAVVCDRSEVSAAVIEALEARGVACTTIEPDSVEPGFAGAADALSAAVRDASVDAVVVALHGGVAAEALPNWQAVLAEHADLVSCIHLDAAWARAVADQARSSGHPMRLVTLTEATTSGGRSRSQAAAQLARAARRATADGVSAFAVSVEISPVEAASTVGEFAAYLVSSPAAADLSGAELVVGTGWLGLRSHPHPIGSITFGGPEMPTWFDDALRRIVGEEDT